MSDSILDCSFQSEKFGLNEEVQRVSQNFQNQTLTKDAVTSS